MAWDPDLGATVVFGGADSTGVLDGDTWTFNDATGTWKELFPTSAPTPRAYASMAYDPTDHLLVLFGGWNGGTLLADTWGLTATGAWTNLTPGWISPQDNPAPRVWADLAQSPGQGLVLYGGLAGFSSGWADAGDTWQYSVATGWTQLCLVGSCGPTTPGPLYASTMAYDPVGSEDVLFGGVLPNGQYSNATWIYNATGWLNESYLLHPSPEARAFAASTAVGGFVAVLGGIAEVGGNTYEMSDAWTFAPPTPSPSWTTWDALVFGGWVLSATSDPVTGTALVWGELNDTYGPPSTVEGDAGAGFLPIAGPPAMNPGSWGDMPMAYDAADGYTVEFGEGANANFPTTWKYAAGVWTNITPATVTTTNSPPAIFASAMAYDAADAEVILFGGELQTNGLLYTSTWAFKGGVWTNVTSAVAPPGVLFPSLAPAGTSGPVLLFGGEDHTSAVQQETWSFSSGTWSPLFPAVSPPARDAGAMVEDPQFGGALLYGGFDASRAVLDDTWRFDARNSTWVEVCGPVCTGAQIYYPAIAYDPRDNQTVLVGGETGYGWTLTGATWSEDYLWPSPEIRWVASMTWDGAASDGYLLLYGGYIGYFGWSDTWTMEPLLTAGAPMLSRAALDASQQNLTLSAPVSGGGLSPSVETWENLPAGCSGQNGTSITCTPSSTSMGNYSIFNLAVSTDGLPSATGTPVTLQVDPPLTVASAPTANSTRVLAGGWVDLWANASGGSGLYADHWHGLAGAACLGATESLSCELPVAGNYTVSLTVTDSNGVSLTTGTLAITVYGPLSATMPVISPEPDVLGGSLTISTVASGGLGPYVYSWSGLPSGCASASSATLSCTPSVTGDFGVRAWVNDSAGDRAFSGASTLSVLPVPASLSLSASGSPQSGPAPLTVAFSTVTQGGAPPVSYNWAFGDGSHGAGGSPLHTYPAPGGFTATVWANDSAGQTASATVPVTVAGVALSLVLATTPGQIALGQLANISASVQGGTGPLSFAWSGLPPGCTAPATAWLSCTPTASGSFTIGLTVTDSAGRTASSSATLVVVGPTSPGGRSTGGFLLWQLGALAGIMAVALVLALLRVGLRRSRTSSQTGPSRSPGPDPHASSSAERRPEDAKPGAEERKEPSSPPESPPPATAK